MLFNKKKEEVIPPHDLAHPFLTLIRSYKNNEQKEKAHKKTDVIRWLDCVRNINVTGGVGSGKTTGSVDTILRKFMEYDLGGCIRIVKSDETERLLKLFKKAGKLHKVKIIKPGGKYKFNFLKYEAERLQHDGGAFVDSVVNILMTVIKISNRMNGSGSSLGGDSPFWPLAMERLMRVCLTLLMMAKKSAEMGLGSNVEDIEISIPNLSKVIRDTPIGSGHLEKFESLSPPQNMHQHEALQSWSTKSYTLFCLSWADKYINTLYEKVVVAEKELTALETENNGLNLDEKRLEYARLKENFESEERSYEVVKSYFLSEYSQLAEKTRTSIVEYVYAFSSNLRSGPLADLFSTTTSPEIIPENLFKNNDIVILDMPVLTLGNLGLVGQTIFSKIWRDASLRRVVKDDTMPLFNLSDEAQYFMSEDEILYNTVSRSARMINIYITQSITNYIGMMGGESAKPLVDSLLGNLAVNIFHNSTSSRNNEYASELIGKDYRGNFTASDKSSSVTEQLEFRVLPKVFQTLKTGGKNNDEIVEAIITISDKTFSNGKNYLKVIFKQDLN